MSEDASDGRRGPTGDLDDDGGGDDPEATARTSAGTDAPGGSDDSGGIDDPRVAEGMFDEGGAGSALAHLYRGEIHRMKAWRERLDRTTNWAVIVMAAVLTWAFSSENNPHYVILVGAAAISVFLVIESRRYRGYDIWRSRVRVLQENVFAYALDRDVGLTDPSWREKLSRDYVRPTMKLSFQAAVAHRLRRVYLPLFALLLFAWVIRVTSFSVDAWPESAAIGMIPGLAVSAVVAATALLVALVAARPRSWKGELHEADPDAWDRHRPFEEVSDIGYPVRHLRRGRPGAPGSEPDPQGGTTEDESPEDSER